MSLGNVNLSLDLYCSLKPLPIAAATSSEYEDCPYTAKKGTPIAGRGERQCRYMFKLGLHAQLSSGFELLVLKIYRAADAVAANGSKSSKKQHCGKYIA